jgi:tetratricopeptide (TPR) repeat protein
MKPESIVLAVAGAFFGLIVGWVIGSQQTGPPRVAFPPAAVSQPARPAQDQASMPAAQAPRQLDQAEAQRLSAAATKDPADAQVRVDLGNLYFDADRFTEAASWYQAALTIRPADADVSTDLGVCYHYMNDPDRALQQFAASLKIDPKHVKTLLNQGVVRAFGQQDLQGAVASWEKVIEIAPTSAEADTARKALQGLKTAHPDLGAKPPAPAAGK